MNKWANQVLQATAGLALGFNAGTLGPTAPEHYRSPQMIVLLELGLFRMFGS